MGVIFLQSKFGLENIYISHPINTFNEQHDGHSGGVTPGPIPNPEVKPTHVLCCTVVREPTGSLGPSRTPGSMA